MLPMCYLAVEHCKNDVNKHHAMKYQNWLWKQLMRRGHVYPLGSGEGVVGLNHRFPNVILRIHLTFFAGIYLYVRKLLKK